MAQRLNLSAPLVLLLTDMRTGLGLSSVVPRVNHNKTYLGTFGERMMDSKDIAGGLLMLGLLGGVIWGMAQFQPEQPKPQEAAYELKGFPALPVRQP